MQAVRQVRVVDVVLCQLGHQRVQSVVDELLALACLLPLRLRFCDCVGRRGDELVQQNGLADLRMTKKEEC